MIGHRYHLILIGAFALCLGSEEKIKIDVNIFLLPSASDVKVIEPVPFVSLCGFVGPMFVHHFNGTELRVQPAIIVGSSPILAIGFAITKLISN